VKAPSSEGTAFTGGRVGGARFFYFNPARPFPHPGPSRHKEGLRFSSFPYFCLMACQYNLAKGSDDWPSPPGRGSKRGWVTLSQNVSPLLRLPKVQNGSRKSSVSV